MPGERTDETGDRGMKALERALKVFLEWQASGSRESRETLLERHSDLAELLEPMISGGEPDTDGVHDGERWLGKYRVRRELGRGGMGVVYEADDTELGRTVALKVLPAHMTLSSTAIARFQREANLAAQLNHPGIVSVYGVGEAGDHHFFAMELLHGAPLDRALSQLESHDMSVDQAIDRLSSDEVDTREFPHHSNRTSAMVSIAAQVADALAYAHAHGVLHRDVKPSNIIVQRSGRVVLTDFGLARQGDAPGVTQTGMFAGTPNYASPEQTLGDWQRVGPPSDVFSLAATLYEMVSGVRAFDGPDVARAIRDVDPPALDREFGIDPDLSAIVHKALEKDPLRRYASALELGNDLRAWLEHRPVSARRASAYDRGIRWVRREPLRAAIVAILAIGVPSLAGLSGYVWASADAIEIGEREIEQKRLDTALDRAFTLIGRGRLGAAMAGLDAVLAEHGPHPEALAGQLLVFGRLFDGRPFRRWLEVHRDDLGDDTGIRALADEMRRGQATNTDWLVLRQDWDASDYMIAGLFCRAKATADSLPEWNTRGLHLLQQAAMTGPRLHYFTAWARAAAEVGDDTAIEASLEGLRRFFSDRVPALLAIAEICRERSPREAEEALALAREVAPDDAEVMVAIARHHSTGDADLIAAYDSIVARHPEHSPALVRRAALAVEAEQVDLARDLLLRAKQVECSAIDLDRWGGVSTLDDSRGYSARFAQAFGQHDLVAEMALLMTRIGETDAAIDLLARTRGISQLANDPVSGIAQAAIRGGFVEQASALVERRIADGSLDPIIWLVRAKAANARRDDRATLEAVERAIELGANDGTAHYVHGIALYNLRRFDEAVSAVDRAITVEPTAARMSQLKQDVCSANRDLAGLIAEIERFAEALFREGRAQEAYDALSPYREMPPEQVLPGASEIGQRVAASLERYRSTAEQAR